MTALLPILLFAAWAQESGAETELRLEDLEQIALAHPSISQAQADVRVAQSLAKQAGLYPNPTVGYYGDEIRGGSSSGGKQGGFVSQTILIGGKRNAARRLADAATRQAETLSEEQRLRVLTEVRRSYYQALGAQRLTEVRRNLAKLAADAGQTAQQLANVGQADRPDVLQAEIEDKQAAVGVQLAEQNLRSSWRILAATVGKPELPQARLAGNLEALPDISYDEWLASTLANSPEVMLALQGVARSEAALVQARTVPIPDLQLSANLTQNNEPLEGIRKPTGLNAGVQIGVQLPLFNRNQGAVAAARAEIESAKQQLARVKLRISRDLAGEFRDYESARVSAQQYKTEMLPRAERAYHLYQASYQRMQAAYPQVLIAQRTLFQLQVDYLQALESAWQNLLSIQGFGLVEQMPGREQSPAESSPNEVIRARR